MEIGVSRVNKNWPWLVPVPNLGELGFKGRSLIFIKYKSLCFQLWSEPEVLNLTKLLFKMDAYTEKKEKGTNFKIKLPKVRHMSAHRSPFGNLHHFSMFAASPSSPTVGISCTPALKFTTSVPEPRQDVDGTPRESSKSIATLDIATEMTIFKGPLWIVCMPPSFWSCQEW